MDDTSLRISLGDVTSQRGRLTFHLVVEPNMQGRLLLHAYDPTDMRKSGTLIQLDEKGISDLKQVIQKMEQTIIAKRINI